MGTYPLYFIFAKSACFCSFSAVFRRLSPKVLVFRRLATKKISESPFIFRDSLIYKIIWSDAKRSEQIIFRNFYTATTIQIGIQVQNPVKQEVGFTMQ
jgi:hypothetical protein